MSDQKLNTNYAPWREEFADELSFVSEEVRELYKNKSYYTGTPLIAELIVQLRLLVKEMREKKEVPE